MGAGVPSASIVPPAASTAQQVQPFFGAQSKASLIGGAIPVIGTIVTGILQYRQSELARRDVREGERFQAKQFLRGQKAAEQQARQTHELAVRIQEEAEREKRLTRKEAAEQKGYGRAMGAYQRAANILNQQQVNLAARAAPLMRRT